MPARRKSPRRSKSRSKSPPPSARLDAAPLASDRLLGRSRRTRSRRNSSRSQRLRFRASSDFLSRLQDAEHRDEQLLSRLQDAEHRDEQLSVVPATNFLKRTKLRRVVLNKYKFTSYTAELVRDKNALPPEYSWCLKLLSDDNTLPNLTTKRLRRLHKDFDKYFVLHEHEKEHVEMFDPQVEMDGYQVSFVLQRNRIVGAIYVNNTEIYFEVLDLKLYEKVKEHIKQKIDRGTQFEDMTSMGSVHWGYGTRLPPHLEVHADGDS